eukprot:1692288-Alexandrium_andersonii.AAC.1
MFLAGRQWPVAPTTPPIRHARRMPPLHHASNGAPDLSSMTQTRDSQHPCSTCSTHAITNPANIAPGLCNSFGPTSNRLAAVTFKR